MTNTVRAILDRYQVTDALPYPVRLGASRSDLPKLCKALGFTSGAEVGVWKGEYSEAFCREGLAWTCVDPWAPYAAYRDNKNQQELIDQAYRLARNRLYVYNARFLRMTSVDAAAEVEDRSLDVVYIDGNHEAPYVLEDVAIWSRKVRAGGIISGHDYHNNSAKPYIQVKDAIDAYTAEQGIAPWFIFAGDKTPSFLWVVE